jgi:hypothetical protein
MGLSVSSNTIHDIVDSLSAESADVINELGQTLLAAYGYDNFDINLKPSMPKIEDGTETLRHLTSGLMFKLHSSVTLEHMRVSEYLWKRSHINPRALHTDLPAPRSYTDLLRLHPDPSPGPMSRRDRFNAYLFLRDLVEHGPEYFHQFKSQLPVPEVVDAIPLTKATITPTRSMDLNNSTVTGNIQTIAALLQQGGFSALETTGGQPGKLDPYVIIVHGDLGTGEKLKTGKLRRSIESTSMDRLQSVIFCPGLFHVKMAFADALWRTFIEPAAARTDTTSLLHDIAILRRKETGKIASKCDFRTMHQIIGQDGLCRRLDCWRVDAARRDNKHSDLEKFAASKPSFKDLEEIANYLASNYISNDNTLRKVRRKPELQRDKQHENGLIMNEYFCLYEELSYAMNHGDIGRVETCLVPFSLLCKATGKHKYAAAIIQFLTDVHFLYPDGLR